jgi:serine/threonine protein kinase
MRNQLNEGVVLNGRYETISPLNHGSFGMVFQAKDLVTGDNVAIKVITKSTAVVNCPSTFAVDDRSEELGAHVIIGNHPNVVNLIQSFETENHIYIVLEFCSNGDLYEAIRVGKGPLETEHVRDFMFQLVDAVEFIHSKGIQHRDIKPENIFLTQSGSMKLGDFGLATTDKWSHEIAVGSDRYMAPEQYEPGMFGYGTAKADIWAIGIVLLNVLFQRNPFAVPSTSDPLYADFALDRQSLFDVFPNMSQDTFEVIRHCLAIDPEKRDLTSVRDALARAVSFTTDDESLDDFCTEERDVVAVGANREPLRTPSISTPQLDNGSFPWAKALAMSPPQQIRQLSAIPDTEIYAEDMFPGPPYDVKPDTASAASFVDSGLGLSFKSTDTTQTKAMNITRSKPMPISGSLPAKHFSSMSSVFGKKRDVFSKSWSDLWDEEDDEQFLAELENNYPPFAEEKEQKIVVSEAGSGVSTPRGGLSRVGLSELKNPAIVNNSRSRSPKNRRAVEHVSATTGFVFEEHQSPPAARMSPSPKRSSADKWAALGDRRRNPASPQVQQQSPAKFIKSPKTAQPTPTPARKRSRTSTGRRPIHWGPSSHNENNHHNLPHQIHGVWEQNNWYKSKDWRQHSGQPLVSDDLGDFEWVW